MTRRAFPVLLIASLLFFGCAAAFPPADARLPAPGAVTLRTHAPAVTGEPGALRALMTFTEGDESFAGLTLASLGGGENVLYVSGARLLLTDSSLNKQGDAADADSLEHNACVRADGGAQLTLNACTLTTDAFAGAALYAAGADTLVQLTEPLALTTGDASPAFAASDGALLNAAAPTLVTEGASAPCVLLESAAAALTGGSASAANAPVAELMGMAKLTLADMRLSGASGFALTGGPDGGDVSLFLTGGSVSTTGAAPLLSCAGAAAHIKLTNTVCAAAADTLLCARGGSVELTLASQTVRGTIEAQEGALVSITLSDGSEWTGAYLADDRPGARLVIDETSVWQVTDDSTLSVLISPDTTFSCIASNGFNVYYDSEQLENAPLGSKSYRLPGGGFLIPRI